MKISALKRFSGMRESDETARAFTRCFCTDDGKAVLEYLHHHVLFRVTDPNMSQENLRHLEGQRQLVLLICQMTAKSP